MFRVLTSASSRELKRHVIRRLQLPQKSVTTWNSTMRIPRRAFHDDYGSPIPEYQFTPTEEITLDVSAWFIAIAMCFPSAICILDAEDIDHETPAFSNGGRATSSRKASSPSNGGDSSSDSASSKSSGHPRDN